MGSVLPALGSNSGNLHDLSTVNLNPLFGVIVFTEPAVAIASFILVTDSGSVRTPILVVLCRRRDCRVGNLGGKLDTNGRGTLYLWRFET